MEGADWFDVMFYLKMLFSSLKRDVGRPGGCLCVCVYLSLSFVFCFFSFRQQSSSVLSHVSCTPFSSPLSLSRHPPPPSFSLSLSRSVCLSAVVRCVTGPYSRSLMRKAKTPFRQTRAGIKERERIRDGAGGFPHAVVPTNSITSHAAHTHFTLTLQSDSSLLINHANFTKHTHTH